MKTSEQINEIAAALSKAQGTMKNAHLNKVNPHFKSKYADLAGIRDAVTPALSQNGIAVVQGTDFDDGQFVVVTRLVHSSGQWFESRFPIAIDKPQAMGSAYTYAKRYSLSAICNIAADEDDDANAANDSKPPEAPKAYDRNPIVRAKFEEFQRGLRQIQDIGNIEDLNSYWATNKAIIKNLPADWRQELSELAGEVQEAIEAKMPEKVPA